MGCTCSRAHWNNVADVIPLLLSLFPSLPFIYLPFYPFLPFPTPNFTMFTFLPFIPHPLYDLKISRRDESAHPPFSMQPRGFAKVYLESQRDLEFLAEDDQLLGEMKLHCIIFELFLFLVPDNFTRFSFIFYFSNKIALALHNSNWGALLWLTSCRHLHPLHLTFPFRQSLKTIKSHRKFCSPSLTNLSFPPKDFLAGTTTAISSQNHITERSRENPC